VLTAITTNTITDNPLPYASFTVSRSNPLVGTNVDFIYTGGTPGASFAWDFGPGATPATSTAQNPAGVVYATPGPKLPTLKVTLSGCEAEPALALVNVGDTGVQLNAQRSGGDVVLSWSDFAYHLQASPTVTPLTVWTNVPGASPVTVPIGTGSLFFRLANP
jgi:PKD repeat protein